MNDKNLPTGIACRFIFNSQINQVVHLKQLTLFVSLLASILVGCGEDNKTSNNINPNNVLATEVQEKNSLFGYWQNSNNDVILIDTKKSYDSEAISTMVFLPSVIFKTFKTDNSAIVPTKRITLEKNNEGYLAGKLDFDESKSEAIESVQVAVGDVVNDEVRVGYSIQFKEHQGTIATNWVFKKLDFLEGARRYYVQLQEISPVFGPNYYKKMDPNKDRDNCANRPSTLEIPEYVRGLNLACLKKLLGELPKDEKMKQALTDALYQHVTNDVSPNLEIVKVLVENGASVAAKDAWGSSLFKSMFSGWRSGFYGDIPDGFPAYVEMPAIISYLVVNGANLAAEENKDNFSVFYRMMQLGLLDTARKILASGPSSEFLNDYGREYGYTYLYGLFMDYKQKFGTHQSEALWMAEMLIRDMKVEFSTEAAVQLVEYGTSELLDLTKKLGWLKLDQGTYNTVRAESDESIKIAWLFLALRVTAPSSRRFRSSLAIATQLKNQSGNRNPDNQTHPI